jgi:hypothetical protein
VKLTYSDQVFDVTKPDALEYVKSVFLSTMESRQGKATDTDRSAKVMAVLQNLERGIIPARGSKGSTREPWEAEKTVILRSMLESAGIETTLKGESQVLAAIAKLADHLGKDTESFTVSLDERAKARYELLNAPL